MAEFREVIEEVLTRWTGLKLAVDHGMGTKDAAVAFIDYISSVLHSLVTDDENRATEELADYLDDYMDEHFDTLCEDGSPAEVSETLVRLWCLFKSGNISKLQEECQKFPPCQKWMSPVRTVTYVPAESGSMESQPSGSTEPDENMDTEWTEVKSRRRKH